MTKSGIIYLESGFQRDAVAQSRGAISLLKVDPSISRQIIMYLINQITVSHVK